MAELQRLSFSSKDRRKPILVEIDGEEFTMQPVPGMVFKDFLTLSMRPDPDDPVVKRKKDLDETEALFEIFRQCMDDHEYDRFAKFARSSEGPDLLTLVEVVQGVVEASAAGFPTSPPSPSSPGQTPAGTGSTDDAPSPAST